MKSLLASGLALTLTAAITVLPAQAEQSTRQLIKGGAVGAGIGAGAAVLLDRPVGKSALVGAGVGAGTQAVRNSQFFKRHPVAKKAAYGALVGAGTNKVLRGGSATRGAAWGGIIGAGVGAYQNMK